MKTYKEYYKLAKQGTIILFDNNIIHRANVAKKNHRDVVNFMMKPSIEQLVPYVSREYTGSNRNKDVFVDPAHKRLIFK